MDHEQSENRDLETQGSILNVPGPKSTKETLKLSIHYFLISFLL